jgi:CheY-like chemotaxis protein
LQNRGYAVIPARYGSEALRELESARPDAIVLDLTMPAMDGWTFAEQFRERAGNTSVPIVAVSAEGELAAGYKELGVRAFFRKHSN